MAKKTSQKIFINVKRWNYIIVLLNYITAQNLNDFNLIAKVSERDMVASDGKYHLNCLTSLYWREKKINRTHCAEPVDKQIMKGTLVFSFRNTAKFEVSPLTNSAPELIIITSLF